MSLYELLHKHCVKSREVIDVAAEIQSVYRSQLAALTGDLEKARERLRVRDRQLLEAGRMFAAAVAAAGGELRIEQALLETLDLLGTVDSYDDNVTRERVYKIRRKR